MGTALLEKLGSTLMGVTTEELTPEVDLRRNLSAGEILASAGCCGSA